MNNLLSCKTHHLNDNNAIFEQFNQKKLVDFQDGSC